MPIQKDIIEVMLDQFGRTGFPIFIKPEFSVTWDKFVDGDQAQGRQRVIQVLNFLHQLKNAGINAFKSTPKIPGITRFTPDNCYKLILKSKFQQRFKEIVKLIRKYNLNNVLDLYKSDYDIYPERILGRYSIQYTLIFKCRPKDNLDNAFTKLRSQLWLSTPESLKQRWVQRSVNSKAKPKSALPKLSELVNQRQPFGWYPLYVHEDMQVLCARSAEDYFVVKFCIINQTMDNVDWLTQTEFLKTVKALFRDVVLHKGN